MIKYKKDIIGLIVQIYIRGRMRKIIIDIDDVICYSNFLNLMNEYLHTNYKRDDFKTYRFQVILDKDKKKFYDFLKDKNVYEKVTFLPNCKKVIKKLSQKYDIYICSACAMFENYENSGRFFVDKYNFLLKHFPYLNPEHFIFTSDKNMLIADIIIDDNIFNLQNNIPLKFIMTAYHNKEISNDELKKQNIERVDSWKEIEEKLLK